MNKGIKVIDRGEPLDKAPWGELKPVNFCATCKQVATLQAKIYVYEKIIANSNFAPMVQAMKTPAGVYMRETTPAKERKSRWTVRKPMTEGKPYEVQCEICGHTAAEIVGAKSYEEALERFKEWLAGDEGNTFTRHCPSCGVRMEGIE